MWRAWAHWLRRLFLLDPPEAPPLGADSQSIIEAATASRRAAERIERLTIEQAQRMHDLEDRLRLLERRTRQGHPPGAPRAHDAG